MPQKVQIVTVRGFSSIKDATVELGALNVLIGANGAGKSNFIDALEMLGRIVDSRLGAFVNVRGGGSELLHKPSTGRIELAVDAERNAYRAVLEQTRDDRLIFTEEATRYRDPETGNVSWVVIGSGHAETELRRAADEKGNVSAEHHAIELLRGCRVYHFHDTSQHAPVKQPAPTADNLALHPDGSNLAAVLAVLRDASLAVYRRILDTVRLAAPFFGDFVLQPESNTDRIRLRWRHVDSDQVFSAHQLSDGTLRFISLATLLLDYDRLPRLVVLDEPELGLHPFAIVQVAEMLRAASTTSQVVAATQSVTLVDQIELSDLIVVERDAGGSAFSRPDSDELGAWLDQYSVGELWQKALLGGRPREERN